MIPNGTRFIGIATSVDLVERKSAILNKTTDPYTIEDIAEYIGRGDSIDVVINYSTLPLPSTVTDKFYWCEESQGTKYLPGSLGGDYYPLGMYYSNGIAWSFLDVPYQASQIEVDNGFNSNKFITSFTLKNSSQWSTKFNSPIGTILQYIKGDGSLGDFPTLKDGTVTSVAALTLGAIGTDLSSTVVNGTTTPVITLNIPTASATKRGALSKDDWTTFNNKLDLPSLTLGSVLFSNGTTIAQDNNNLYWDNTNKRLGIGTNTPVSSSILDLNSTTKGFLPPRMTTVQRTAIVSPANGLVIYNSDYNWLDCYNGANWYAVGSSISGELGIINYTYTGTLLNNPIAVITAPPPALASGYVPDYSGKWVSTLVLPTNNPSLQTFTFVDLQGIMGSFTANSIPSLTALNFPALTQILGSFSPGTFTSLSTITVPLLTYVGGSFTPNGLSAFVSMAYPVLHDVVGSFSPTNLAAVTSFSFPALTNVGNFQPSFMAGLTAMTLPSLTTVTGTFSPNTMSALASMTFASLSNVANGFTPNTMSGIVSMSCPSLTTVGGNFAPSGMNALTNMSFPALANVGGSFSPSAMDGITLVSFPNLYSVGIDFAPTAMVAVQVASFSSLTHIGGTFGPNTMNGLTSLTVPALVTVGGNLAFSKMDGVYVLTFPSLTDIGGAVIPSSMVVIEQIFLGAIERIGATGSNGTVIALSSGTPTLTVFSLGSNLKQVGNNGVGNVIITSAVLGQVYVDQLLVRLAALDGTNGTTTFNNRIVTIKGTSATPSPTGLAAKAVLQARGCVVTHN